MADIHALVFGDGSPAGTGITDESERWPQLLATALSLTPHVYAAEGAGYTVESNSVLAQLTVAAADAAVPADSVGLVVLAAGYEDAKAKADVSSAAAQVFAIANAIRKRYRNAKLAIMVGPQGLEPDGFEDSYAPFLKGLSSAARTVGADVVIDAWDWLFGKPEDVQSDKVHPNEAGHALIATQAQPLMPAVDVPEPQDLTPVDPLGVRKYAPGRADWSKDSVRSERRRNKEKNQANNSTGSETEQTTIKLNALTKQLQAQQELTTGLTGQLAQTIQQQQLMQGKLAEQQTQLGIQQDTLKDQQSQLTDIVTQLQGIVSSQGDTVDSLKSVTDNLTSQQNYMQNLVSYTYDEFERLAGILGGYQIIYAPLKPPEF
jgi:lysophospholipase L1-like esterase